MRELAGAGAKDACVLDGDGTERRVPVAALRPGDRFVVRPGETIAADGTVLFGESAVDRSMMTGESVPVDVAEGDSVTAGTVAVSGRLIVGAAKVGSDTQLAHLVALVEDAQAQKAAIQRLADRISGVFVPVILVLAMLTLTGWLVAGSTGQQAFSAALAVLIIACPCALGLATPAALVVASGRGAQLGIFIKGYQALESSRSVDTVVLDKTGTVTTGVMAVTGVAPAAGTSRAGLLRHAGAVEQASEHAVAAAISAAACAELGSLPHADGFTALPGLGARGAVDGHDVIVGREKLLRDCGLDIPAGLAAQCVAWERAGRTVVLAGWDGQARGAVAVADTVKPSAAGAVAALRGLGLRTILLTGDNQATADAVAAEAGIGEVIAGAMPGRQGGGDHRPAGAGPVGGHGRGRGQRRPRAGRGRPGAGHRLGYRRGHLRRRHDPAPRRPWHRSRRDQARPRDAGHHPAQPCLGVRVQHRRDPAGRRRVPQPADRRGGDGRVVGLRGGQQRAAAPVRHACRWPGWPAAGARPGARGAARRTGPEQTKEHTASCLE